jgi:hypothetical protein
MPRATWISRRLDRERLPQLVMQNEADSVRIQRMPPFPPPAGCRPPAHLHSCDGQHIRFPAPHLASDSEIKGGCDMVADWIVIYAVLFVLAAAVVGNVPSAQ